MSEAVRRMGEVSREYELRADSAEQVYTDAARAEAAYKHQRARAVLRHKLSGDRMSVAEAEIRADAQDDIAELHQRRLTTQAASDALKAKLTQMREQNANGRTAVVDERAVDTIHARGHSGAA
jgi:hypothetical protein